VFVNLAFLSQGKNDNRLVHVCVDPLCWEGILGLPTYQVQTLDTGVTDGCGPNGIAHKPHPPLEDGRFPTEEDGYQKSNLGAGQPKLAGSFVIAHRS